MTRFVHRLVGHALDRGNGLLAQVARLHPERAFLRGRVRVEVGVPYGPRADRRLDVWRSRRHAGVRPAALYLHGGGFRVLSKDTHGLMAAQLALAGWTVFCADYRLAPKHRFPAGLEDAAEAMRWVLDHAPSYGADPQRLLLAGESAGGGLVTSLTLASCFERPEPYARSLFDRAPRIVAAAPLCPFLDVAGRVLSPRERATPGWIQARVFQIVDEYAGHVSGDAAFFASPLRALESDLRPARPLPPIFASCGSDDVIVQDTRRLARALDRRGTDHEVRFYTGESHAFQAMLWRPQARQSWRDLVRFVEARDGGAQRARARARA